MKILLIDPPGNVVGLNSGLAYLASSLVKEGIFVHVLDFNNFPRDTALRLKAELKNNYEVIGLSIKTNTVISAVEIAKSCKTLSAYSLLLAGGPGISAVGKVFLDENPVFDYLISGEVENTLSRFLNNLNDPETFKDIPGLCYRKGNEIMMNPSELVQDIDRIAFPDYSCFDRLDFSKNSYPLVTSRGCPYDCAYCNVHFVSGRRFRGRSPENVIAELKHAKEKYRINNFQVYDDTFTQDIARAKRISKLMIGEKLGLSWVCQNGIRADRVDKELLCLMKEAGCQGVWFGVESLDEEVFKNINKAEAVPDVLRALEMAREAGIPRSGFFIIGLPGSTYEKDMATLKKAKKLKLNLATWSLATPYPCTRLWDWVHANGKTLRDFRNLSFFIDAQCAFETKDYPEHKRLEAYYKANLAFSRYECLSADRNQVKRIFKIFFLILKYDALRFPCHFLKGSVLFVKKIIGIKRR